ncbi:hypothetical protein HOP62_02640 [Halomonas sp. MCCC 1A17488]|uniref:hypothetical protein n=1 Tax=unclassified Halomonas TaxID=2609666 RepID=UPI0018D24C99|nr:MULTISPECIES: hypothetical protein [unclassified Halomonas]MCE8014971.1 hypothetical protein [Halomonas sp. MCCC 1A17488]MCG3238304.1 hypothetical protein [Halomonas sp. MCCC 1A17488]QPP47943.1 hypothetical protein I4484_11760 [Halomonas sp. SS10-MC5]
MNITPSNLYRHVVRFAKAIIAKEGARIAKKIDKSNDPGALFITFQRKKNVSLRVLWEALSHLRNLRSPAYDVIANNKALHDELNNLIGLHKALSSPSPIVSEEMDQFVSFYKKQKNSVKNKSEYRRLLISLIVKKLPPSQACEAFSSAGLIDKITIHDVLKVLRKASAEGESNVFFDLKKKYLHQMSPPALVKAKYWEGRLVQDGSVVYKEIESDFCQLDKTLSKEYKLYLLGLLEAIPNEKNSLDCQIKSGKFVKIKRSIEEKIQLQQPFSFVRLNDGEGYGFPDVLPCPFDVERQELHWWGEVLSPELRNTIQENFRRSLPEHDLVGIPSVFRFIDELSINRDYSIFNNALLCRLFTLCHGYLKIYNGRAHVTEGQINLYLFDREYITKLAKLARRVVFISGAKREYLQSVFEDLPHATYIELPTHRLLKAEKFSCSEATQPLPYVYENYLDQIRSLAGPGVVFFISAGFIGKIFAAEVAKKGGVALDVGQSLMNIVANNIDA